jgi:hypothetical protein
VLKHISSYLDFLLVMFSPDARALKVKTNAFTIRRLYEVNQAVLTKEENHKITEDVNVSTYLDQGD